MWIKTQGAQTKPISIPMSLETDVDWHLELSGSATAPTSTTTTRGRDDEQVGVHVTQENFVDFVTNRFKAVVEKHSGPMQYLKAQYKTDQEKSSFAMALAHSFPKREDTEYLEANTVPNSSEEFNISLHQLGFEDFATTKPPPFKHTVYSLLDEYLTNSCITQGLGELGQKVQFSCVS